MTNDGSFEIKKKVCFLLFIFSSLYDMMLYVFSMKKNQRVKERELQGMSVKKNSKVTLYSVLLCELYKQFFILCYTHLFTR
jgi:hypothetical protein